MEGGSMMATDHSAIRGDVFPDFEAFRRRRRQTPPGVVRRPLAVCEALEVRRLYSVSVIQNTTTNIVTITGDSGDNVIRVWQENYEPNDLVTVRVVDQATYGFWLNADLTLIKFFGDAGIDDIEFGSNTYGFLLGDMPVGVPAEIRGGIGDDLLTGTDNADYIYGELGADQLWGAGGDDYLYGGYGGGSSDNGNDILQGDGGADSMYGEDGNDIFKASDGVADYLDGGGGSDTATLANRDTGTPSDTTVSIENLT
jgi:Ca2+-binding RTX toxin-like protein